MDTPNASNIRIASQAPASASQATGTPRFAFGARSLARLATCHPDLQRVMHAAIASAPADFTVLCGHRSQAEQDAAVAAGNSKTPWPRSKHNSLPSLAVDIAPYPIDWRDRDRFVALAAHIFLTAQSLGVTLRWGGDFNMDGDKTTSDAWDLPHFELLSP